MNPTEKSKKKKIKCQGKKRWKSTFCEIWDDIYLLAWDAYYPLATLHRGKNEAIVSKT